MSSRAKFFIVHRFHVNQDIYRIHTEMRIDSLLIPAFLAVWLQRGSHQQLLRRLLPSWSFFLLLPLYLRLLQHYSLSPMTSCVAPLLLLSTVYNPHMFVGRILESKALRWVGRLSYSLYLWQQLFICHRFVGYKPLGISRHPLSTSSSSLHVQPQAFIW